MHRILHIVSVNVHLHRKLTIPLRPPESLLNTCLLRANTLLGEVCLGLRVREFTGNNPLSVQLTMNPANAQTSTSKYFNGGQWHSKRANFIGSRKNWRLNQDVLKAYFLVYRCRTAQRVQYR